MNKEKKKIFRRKLGRIGLKGIFYLAKFLPFKMFTILGRGAGFIWYLVSKRHKKIALQSLNTAFAKTKTEAELKRITKESFLNMGEAGFEILSIAQGKESTPKCVDIIGKENLETALKKGKGVIAVSAHLGNFPLMALRIKEEGFKANVMARPMRDKATGDFIWDICRDRGLGVILSYPRKRAVFNSLKALKKNEIITIQMDQNFGTGGVWVKFFGKLAATPVGPVTLALRSGASLVPIFMVRNKMGRHTIYIEKELDLEEGSSYEESVLLGVIKATQCIETKIKEYPELWSWIHRRWKSRPPKEVFKEKFKVQKD